MTSPPFCGNRERPPKPRRRCWFGAAVLPSSTCRRCRTASRRFRSAWRRIHLISYAVFCLKKKKNDTEARLDESHLRDHARAPDARDPATTAETAPTLPPHHY